jgi:HAMP domain-containing protein
MGSDDIAADAAEAAQLKSTIWALRAELERVAGERAQELAELRDALDAQQQDLRATIRILRQALESAEAEGRSAADAAMQQLRATVGAMREELERQRAEHATELQRAGQAAQDEIGHLRETVRALRAQLESRRGQPS